MKKTFLLVLLAVFVSLSIFGEMLIVKYPRPASEKDLRQVYRIELLKLALEKTKAAYGDYKVELSEYVMVQSRALTELSDTKLIDIIAVPTSIEREKTYLPIRIPIFKGLLGYRLFIVEKKNENAFKSVKTIDDLKKFTAGFGHDWADLDILKANGLPVETSTNYESLFKMLDAGRFDYFPRGINEINDELEQRKAELPNLVKEKNIALYYTFPTYFFVEKSNIALAKRIETGLNKAIDDGSFDKLFLSFFQDDIKKAELDKRKIIVLNNPYLPKETPLSNSKLWYFKPSK